MRRFFVGFMTRFSVYAHLRGLRKAPNGRYRVISSDPIIGEFFLPKTKTFFS